MSIDYSTMIYTTEQVRQGEREAAKALELSMAQLMQRAAQACLAAMQRHQLPPARVLVLCGPGNNGGDGWVLARLAQQQGYQVQVFAMPPASPLAQDAAAAWRDMGYAMMPLDALEREHFQGVDIIVDAIFGSGLSRPLDASLTRVVELVNTQKTKHQSWLLSIDIPSGLQSDTGQPQPVAIISDRTVTMVALKLGLVTGVAANYCGDIELADLAIGQHFYRNQPTLRAITSALVRANLPARPKAAHKGDFGHVLIVAGGPGMSGAAALAGMAALRCGAGKVSVACHEQARLAIAMQQPELMVHTVGDDSDNLTALLAAATAVVIGPGLGQSAWAEKLVAQVATWVGSVVWDADALTILAAQQVRRPESATWFMTPHPGEAGRMLQRSSAEVSADRLHALTQLCQNFQAHVLLKGAGTLIQAPNSAGTSAVGWVCRRGSPALATGGSGDVLSGIIGALVAQHVAAHSVLPVAAWLHAVAGEIAARHGERGTLASDIIAELRALVNPEQVLDKRVECE